MTRRKRRPKTVATGRHLRMVSTGGWEFAQRVTPSGVVCVVAVTDDDRLLLVEQFRPPVDCNVIELPAGLAGDIGDNPDEPFEAAARRELLEETGYTARRWRRLCDVTSSAGLTDEVVTMFQAGGLKRTETGGGVDGEDIEVHAIKISRVSGWLRRAAKSGKLIDSRVYAALAFISK